MKSLIFSIAMSLLLVACGGHGHSDDKQAKFGEARFGEARFSK